MTAVALCSAMALPSASVPDWVHLLPTGTISTADGRGLYRFSDPDRLIASSMSRGKLVIDENHATDLLAPRGGSAPARGWIVELQRRSDGVWGRVEWVDPAAAVWKGYRSIAPVIVHNRAGTVERLARASLTNTPGFTGQVALHSQSSTSDRNAVVSQIREQIAALRASLASLTDRPSDTRAPVVSEADRQVIDMLGLDENAFVASKSSLR